MKRSDAEISLEISALESEASKYDTEAQSSLTVLCVGAHDALRWALGLAEESISESIERRLEK